MIEYLLIIWGIGLLICSMLIAWHYNKQPDDRLSFLFTTLILIIWPISICLAGTVLFVIWVDLRYFTKEEDIL